ncbi:MAG: Periplasmic binding protein [Actinomycetota bacterium]|nr:Periplasmic binding protein [Actinomycetota bacterium]
MIGLVGSMTGPDSWRGEDAFEGADLGVHILNSNLGRDDPPYQLVTLDDQGEASSAKELVAQLAASERTVGIVYAGPPEGLASSEEVLAEAGIPALLCFGDLYDQRALRPHMFQVSPPYLWQARRIASYLLVDRGYRSLGLLTEESTDGKTAEESLSRALSEFSRRRRTSGATYSDPQQIGTSISLLRRQRPRPQAIVVHGSPAVFSEVIRLLDKSGSRYRTTQAARAGSRRGGAPWRPQVIGFDLAITPFVRAAVPPGTVASDTYARGAHYLPVPSLSAFRMAFEDWWGDEPLGWERRAFEATSMIGWAAEGAGADEDLADQLETLRAQRFGGLDVSFDADDHTSVEPTNMGLWAVPRPGLDVLERRNLPDSMPWVPLGRGFSTDGRRTDIAPQDWRYLFTVVPPTGGPAPPIQAARWGITTPRSDPVH